MIDEASRHLHSGRGSGERLGIHAARTRNGRHRISTLPTVRIVGSSDIRRQDPSNNACINARSRIRQLHCNWRERPVKLVEWVLRRLPRACRGRVATASGRIATSRKPPGRPGARSARRTSIGSRRTSDRQDAILSNRVLLPLESGSRRVVHASRSQPRQECVLHVNVIVFFFRSESGNLAEWIRRRGVLEPLTEGGMRLVLEELRRRRAGRRDNKGRG